MNDRPHLDEDALAELRDVMEDEFELLIRTYVADSRSRMSALRDACDRQDPDLFAKAAHSFKGSCINIGAPRLGDICLQAEQLGKTGDLASAPGLLAQMEEEFSVVADRLEHMAG
ncbi:MAG TPA: Hpt domain-containing protein [Marinobacter sp.]|nr:Hpt domain-containing protein [Marinobacter sp.]